MAVEACLSRAMVRRGKGMNIKLVSWGFVTTEDVSLSGSITLKNENLEPRIGDCAVQS